VIVDLLFPARGQPIPTDHAYPLYAALSRLIPPFHDPTSDIRFAPLTGTLAEQGRLQLHDRSFLRIRLPDDAIRTVLPLAGKQLDVAGGLVRLGPPTVQALTPVTTVESWLVTFKNSEEPEGFLTTARSKLAEIDVKGQPQLRAFESGPRAGEARRRVIRLKGQTIIGYALVVSELTAEESIRLQERGLGGRIKMGCGFFLPAKEGAQ
jgi:CRISPR-associated protein Cas6